MVKVGSYHNAQTILIAFVSSLSLDQDMKGVSSTRKLQQIEYKLNSHYNNGLCVLDQYNIKGLFSLPASTRVCVCVCVCVCVLGMQRGGCT